MELEIEPLITVCQSVGLTSFKVVKTGEHVNNIVQTRSIYGMISATSENYNWRLKVMQMPANPLMSPRWSE